MLNLKLIGNLINLPEGADYWEEQNRAFRNKENELMADSTFIKAIMRDGTEIWMAEANTLGGGCDCCKTVSRSDVAQYDYYVLET